MSEGTSNITMEMAQAELKDTTFHGAHKTSSNELEDLNVHVAFTKAISMGYFSKYEEEIEEI